MLDRVSIVREVHKNCSFVAQIKTQILKLDPFIPLFTTQSTEKFGLKTKCTLIT